METNTLTSEYKGSKGVQFMKQKVLADTCTYEKTRYLIQHHKANVRPLWALGGEEAWAGGEGCLPNSLHATVQVVATP